MSYALVSCCQPSSPDGVWTNVSYAPSASALAFIAATVLVDAAGRLGERHRGVVARHEQQPREELIGGVRAATDQAGPRSLGRGRGVTHRHHLAPRQLGQQRVDGQDLEDAGRLVAPVRVLGGQDVARVQIDQHPGRCGESGRQRGGAGRRDQAATLQGGAADRLAQRSDATSRRVRVGASGEFAVEVGCGAAGGNPVGVGAAVGAAVSASAAGTPTTHSRTAAATAAAPARQLGPGRRHI